MNNERPCDILMDSFVIDVDSFTLPIISVCFNTSDYPGKYTARLFDVNVPTCYVMVRDTLEEIRREIPAYFTCLKRHDNDDPVIVEVWI